MGKTAGIFNRAFPAQCTVPAIIIVFHQPVARQIPDLLQIPERIHIQNILAKAAVKTLDKTVLLRLARLDPPMANPVRTAKPPEGPAGKLRPVVTANVSRETAFSSNDLKAANNPGRRQARIDLNRQSLTVKIVDHIKCPEGSSAA